MIIKKLKRILLIDDSAADNFIHARQIRKADVAEDIIIKNNGQEALDYLNTALKDETFPAPELIFLDINMPVMNGWEFLEKYEKLIQAKKAIIILSMLTTSNSPKDRERATRFSLISDFTQKPLTKEILLDIVTRHFPGRFTASEEE